MKIHSFIFSFRKFSKNAGTGLFTVFSFLVGASVPTVTVFLILFSIVQIWYQADRKLLPVSDGRDSFESVLLSTQLDRARSLSSVDVLLTGDSSSLMGVNARELEDYLGGMKVESLATMGFVGPVGYAAILENYYKKTGLIKTLVILINGHTFKDPERNFDLYGYERMAIMGKLEIDLPPFVASRQKIFTDIIAKAVRLPLRGAYGRYYGWPESISATLHQDHGTMIDPHNPLPHTVKGSHPRLYYMSWEMRRRFMLMRVILDRIKPLRVFFAVTPNPSEEDNRETKRQRHEVETEAKKILGLEDQVGFNPPKTLPTHFFVSPFHLHEEGRKVYTKFLAEELLRTLDENPLLFQ